MEERYRSNSQGFWKTVGRRGVLKCWRGDVIWSDHVVTRVCYETYVLKQIIKIDSFVNCKQMVNKMVYIF